MRPIPPHPIRASFNLGQFIGIPYEELNCWELCVDFYSKMFGVELKHFLKGPVDRTRMAEANDLIYSNMGEFEKVDSPVVGDLILIRVMGIESHIGIYINDKVFLHTRKGVGSSLDRVYNWQERFTGIYRLKVS